LAIVVSSHCRSWLASILQPGLGAAMLAAWSEGRYESLEAAAKDVKMVRRYEPKKSQLIEKKYEKFCKLYQAALEIARM